MTAKVTIKDNHSANGNSALTDTMSPESIVSVKGTIAIDTMLNFNGDFTDTVTLCVDRPLRSLEYQERRIVSCIMS